MSATAVIHLVTNLSNQPLELYLRSGLRVLPPRGRTEVAAADLESPQLQVFRRERLVMIDQGSREPPKPAAHAAQEAEKPPPEADKAPASVVQDAEQQAGATGKPRTSKAEA